MSADLQREQLAKLVASFMSYSAEHLPDDVKARLAQMKEIENDGFAPDIYNVMEKNMQLADSLKRPSCQDTGIPQFFARVGSNWPYMNIIEDALIDAVGVTAHARDVYQVAICVDVVVVAAVDFE